MALPWQVVDRVETAEGPLELRKRSEHDFLITIAGRVLMPSRATESEIRLAQWGCEPIAQRKSARVLVGGLGMGYTLRATVDTLRPDAQVLLAELNPEVVRWCKTDLRELAGRVLDDPRVHVHVADVSHLIADEAAALQAGNIGGCGFDAIIFDLYEGPHVLAEKGDDPLYGDVAISRTMSILRPGGRLAIWGEDQDPRFERRLDRLQLTWTKKMSGRGGRKHVVYLIDAHANRASKSGRSR